MLHYQCFSKNLPLSQSDDKEFLNIVKLFWYNKFEPLGKKLLDENELKWERKLIEEQFLFLDDFLDSDPKVQIISEYERLQRDIRNELIRPNFIHVSSPRNFSFLAQHLDYRLRTLSSSEFLKDLGWLASQDQLFLSCFFCVLEFDTRYGMPPSIWTLAIAPLTSWGKTSVNAFIVLQEEKLFIFSKRTYRHEGEKTEAVRLARIILTKLEVV